MPYAEASYAEVLCWLEDTEIQYVPNGKKAGTKSYDRYVQYSQAKTVAQALEFGSKALDLINDFEKNILKRIGGPVREKPLNLGEVQDTSALSKTDMIIGRFGIKLISQGDGEGSGPVDGEELKQRQEAAKKAFREAQLAAKLGVRKEDLVKPTHEGLAEGPTMVATRSKANVEAAAILEAAASEGRKINDGDVLKVLQLWSHKKNSERKSLMREGVTSIHTETVGLVQAGGGRLMATKATEQYPKVFTLLTRWMKDNRPEGHDRDFPFTSIFVNAGFAAKRHRDHLNLGPVVVKAFGDFTGGELRYWADDDRRCTCEALRAEDASTLEVRSQAAVIDGNRGHEVSEYTGEERFSLVFFTGAQAARATDEVRQQLMEVGFPFPDAEGLEYLKGMLPAPKGYEGLGPAPKAATSHKAKLPREEKRALKAEALSKLQGLKPKVEGAAVAARPRMAGGLLARVLAQRNKQGPQGVAPAPAAPVQLKQPSIGRALFAAPNQAQGMQQGGTTSSQVPGGKPIRPKKVLKFGGLLARVQQFPSLAQAAVAAAPDPETPPAPAAEELRPAEDSTPARKKLRVAEPLQAGSEAVERLALSERKLDRPAKAEQPQAFNPLKRSLANLANRGELEAKRVRLQGGAFLALATDCCSEAEGASTVLAERLKEMTTSAQDSQGALASAMQLLTPAKVVSGGVLAAAVQKAFGSPCSPELRAECLAGLALEGRSRQGVKTPTPLSVREVAEALDKAGGDASSTSAATRCIEELLDRTQLGMEPFLLVRALQGHLALGKDVVHSAVAKLLAPPPSAVPAAAQEEPKAEAPMATEEAQDPAPEPAAAPDAASEPAVAPEPAAAAVAEQAPEPAAAPEPVEQEAPEATEEQVPEAKEELAAMAEAPEAKEEPAAMAEAPEATEERVPAPGAKEELAALAEEAPTLAGEESMQPQEAAQEEVAQEAA